MGNEEYPLEKPVRVIADNMMPYIISGNDTHRLGGYLGDIWQIIEEILKFKSEVISVDYDTGIELITQRKGDVMLAAVVQKKGLQNIEYSQPYFYNWYHLYIKKPKATASSSSYLRTLNNELWCASICLLFMLACLLWLTMFLINRYTNMDKRVSFSCCLLTVVGGFFNQGYDPGITCSSGRLQTLIALLFGLLLYSSMNAVLVAQLAIFQLELPFKSLEEVSCKKTHSLCVRTNSFVYNHFIDANRSILPEWRSVLNGPGCLDINRQENVARVICREQVVVLESRIVISAVRRRFKLPCELAFLKDKLFIKPNSFILSKEFRHKDLIKLQMKRLLSYGVLDRIENQWVTEKVNNNQDQVTISQVTINHVFGILLILILWAVLSILVLIIEITYYKYFGNH